MEMLTKGLVVLCATPGRLRLRVPALTVDALARRVETGLALVPGVQRVDLERRTGALLVEYDAERYGGPADLLALARRFPGVLPPDDLDHLERELAAYASRTRTATHRTPKSAGGTDPATRLLPLVLLAFGVGGISWLMPGWPDAL